MTFEEYMNISFTHTAEKIIEEILVKFKEKRTGILKGEGVADYELLYFDEADDEINLDFPPFEPNEIIATKGVTTIAMVYIGNEVIKSGLMIMLYLMLIGHMLNMK